MPHFLFTYLVVTSYELPGDLFSKWSIASNCIQINGVNCARFESLKWNPREDNREPPEWDLSTLLIKTDQGVTWPRFKMDPTNTDPSGTATWTTQVDIIFLATKFPLSEVCNVYSKWVPWIPLCFMYHTTTHIYLGHETLNNKFVTGFISGKITILWPKRLHYTANLSSP
jgi:hypothetical protein